MFFKVIDKFFDEIKQVVSFVTFILIALALLMFVYWVTYIIKLPLPEGLNNFVWSLMEFFAPLYKDLNIAKNMADVMPVITALIFAIIIYILNCVMVLLEDLHEKAKLTRDMCRNKLEKSINQQLKKSFIDELQKNSFMLVKIKVFIEKEVSNLSTDEVKNFDTESLSREISYKILSDVNSPLVQAKGKTGDSIYFLLTDFDKSRTFFSDLVARSSKILGEKVQPFLKMSFVCSADMYENVSEFEIVNSRLDQILDLNVANKIIVTSAVKIYYETIHPELYFFKMVGEYPLTDICGRTRTTSVYAMQRR